MTHLGQDLVTQFTQGDTRAFTTIYNIYYPRLFNFVKRMVDNRQEAQDITAETFVKLWRLHPNFSTTDKIRAFLFVTARNACYDFLKYNARENSQQKELLHQLLPETDTVVLRDEIKADVLDHIYTAIEQLPQQCKAVFTLSYLEGRKNNEIAELLHITDKTVRNQKVLAKKLLRVALFDHLRVVSLLLWMMPAGLL
ncbi:MAG: RNA polymerase sigma-70 factor [Niastella sp.]|nr:RNA polymerase sigma-70 factor [Niastella sp.]